MNKLIIQNRRYFLVIIILVFAFMFGKNIDPTQSEAQKDEIISALLSKASLPNNVIRLDGSNNEAIIFSNTSFVAGKIYRVKLDTKAELAMSESIYYKNYDEQKLKNKKIGLNICLVSDFGDKECVKKIYSDFSDLFSTKTFLIQPSQNFSKMIVGTENIDEQNKIYVRNCSFSELQSSSLKEAQNLQSTVGETSFNNLQSKNEPADSAIIIRLTKNNLLGGQIFKASSDNISFFEFKPEIVGSGGYGALTAELRTADYINGQYKVGNLISSQSFNIPELSQSIMNNGVLRVNLSSKIQVGKYYYIGLNNSAATYNWLNYIGMGGTKDKNAYSDGVAVTIFGNRISEVGNLFFRVFSANYTYKQSSRVLDGAMIENLDQGIGRYNYQLKKDSSDILDIDSINLGNSSIDMVQFMKSFFSVIGSNTPNTSIIYKFDTIYPASKVYINASSIKDDSFGTKLYYSYDEKNWQEVSQPERNKFEQTLIVNNSNTIFLKISGDQQIARKYFGLSDLKLIAELQVNKI